MKKTAFREKNGISGLMACKHLHKEGFLGMQAVFGLLPDYTLGTFDYFIGYLMAPVRGKAVHHDGIRRSPPE